MNALVITSMVALSVVGVAATASAQCQETFASTVYSPPPLPNDTWRLEVVGTRVTTRGDLGFVAFTMADRFEIEYTPLHTAAAKAWSRFSVWREPHPTATYDGRFVLVFPERGNGDEERMEFRLDAVGSLSVRSVTYASPFVRLASQSCTAGPRGQITVRGRDADTIYTFIVRAVPDTWPW